MEAIAITPAPQPTTPQADTPAANSAPQSDSDFDSTLSQTIDQQNASSDQSSEANSNNNQYNSSDNQGAEEQPAGLAASLPTNQNNTTQSVPQTNTKDISNSELFSALAQEGKSDQTGNKASVIQLTQTTQATTPTEISTTKAEQANSLILNKIQQIITNSNETGNVTIRNEQANLPTSNLAGSLPNTPAFPITEEIVTQATFSAANNSRTTGEINTSNLTSKVALLRQDGQQIQPQDLKLDSNLNSGQNQQQSFSESAGGQQSFSSSPTTVLTANTESTTSFAHVSNQVTETVSQQLQAGNKTGLTTPSTVLQDNEVMNQVIQRFNVNPRLQTSKLSIQLNPAELGQLKIDILVKGDSIKANIVAQSQQAAEIIEKNMLKLKSVLEEQGFSIDDLIVSTVQEGGESFNLFQENYSQSEQFSNSDKKSFNTSDFELPLDEMLANESAVNSSGVNVKI